MSETSTDDLIGRWLRGDVRAGEELGRRYLEKAGAFARRLTESLVDAEEIAGEAIRAGLEGIRAGSKPDQFTLWLRGIVRNIHRHRARRETEVRGVQWEPATEGGQLTAMVGREIGPLLDDLLPQMQESYREVIELHRRGLSREEIAKKLKLPTKAVHMRFERAFRFLRERLSRYYTSRVVRPPVRWEEIRSLRPTFREAMIARHLEERSPMDAARKLGIPLDTLEARLRTAYEALHCDDRTDYAPAREEWRKG